ncbi:MAG: hypothetical protein JOY99_12935 [Sphingomonadaceae bacterium]|nr:hypothetical protein [Sphingomonadaceae bacterium]
MYTLPTGVRPAKPDPRAFPSTQTVTYFSLARIYRICERHGIAHSRFGRDAVNDPALIADMRNGRRLRPETRSRVAAHLAALEGC